MSNQNKYDLVIIGSGPGGEVAAIRASQLGLKVALVEKREHLGGTCLNVGCIPTKALLHSASTYEKLKHVADFGFEIGEAVYKWEKILKRKDDIVDQQRKGLRFLMKKNKVDVYEGIGSFASKTEILVKGKEGETQLNTKYVLIATGSRVRDFGFAKPDHKNILTSDSILAIPQMPKSLAVIGGGVVGSEFASIFNAFGCETTIYELAPSIIAFEDEEVTKELTRLFKKKGIKIKTAVQVESVAVKSEGVEVKTKDGSSAIYDKVLVSIGREPVTDGLNLEKIGLKVDAKGFIPVNTSLQTSLPTIYAIGDVIATPALAHTASAEGMHAVEHIAGKNPPRIHYENNPNAVYTLPEVASVGWTEKQLKEKSIDYQSCKFPFAPLAKAKIEGMTDGFIKILFGTRYREILGVHIVHAKATEFIAEFALGKNMEATLDEFGHTIHPHPTLSETVMEAAHAGLGGAVHM